MSEFPLGRFKPTRYEQILAAISPSRAHKRYVSRAQFELAKRAFESTDVPTRLRKTREDSRSADQVNSLASDRLRFQGRYLDENYDVAKSILNTLVMSIVGEGIMSFPTMRLLNGEFAREENLEMQMLWQDWAERPEATREMSWGEAQQLAARSWFRDGEMFEQQLLGNVQGLDHATEVALSMELMEADFLPVNLFDDGSTPGIRQGIAAGNRVRQGVEKNQWGEPQAYWFWKVYPTEISSQFQAVFLRPINTSLALNSANLNRVDAGRVNHLKLVDRIRQTRGNSVFASVYQRLDDLKDYEESERVAARIGAAFAFAITKSLDTPGAATPSEARWREMDIAPGIIADNLQEGESVESLKNERPSNLIGEFRTSQLRSVSGGTGASFSSFSKEYEGSYSSQRQELVESFQMYRSIRMRFVNNFVKRIYRDFVNLVALQGIIDLSRVDPRTLANAEHLGIGIPYIDPKREVEADLIRVQAGFRSRHETVLDRGGNPEDTFRLIVEETDADEEEDLKFTSSAMRASAAPAPGEDGGGGEQEEEDDGIEDEDVDEEGMLEGLDGGARNVAYLVGRKYQGPDGNVYLYTKNGFVLDDEDEVSNG